MILRAVPPCNLSVPLAESSIAQGPCRPVEEAGAEAGAEAEEAPAGAEAEVSSWNPFLMNCSLTFGIS